MIAPRTIRSAMSTGLSAGDRPQRARGGVELLDALLLVVVDVQGAVGAEGDAVDVARADDPGGRPVRADPHDAAAGALADDVAGVDGAVGGDRDRDGDADVAADGRD